MCRGDSFVGVVYTLVPCLDAKGGVDSSSALTQSQERETNFKSFLSLFIFKKRERTSVHLMGGVAGWIWSLALLQSFCVCTVKERCLVVKLWHQQSSKSFQLQFRVHKSLSQQASSPFKDLLLSN